MAAFFSGVAKVPITSLIMVTEMTGSYGLILPLMLSNSISFLLSQRWSLYEEQVPRQVDSPAHLGDFVVNVLEEIKVKDIFSTDHQKLESIRETTPLTQIITLVEETYQNNFPVLNDNDELCGMLAFDDLRQVLTDEAVGDLIIARDVYTSRVLTTSLDENLYEVLRKLTDQKANAICVLDQLDHKRLLGMLSYKDVVLAYEHYLRRLRKEREVMPLPRTESIKSIPYSEHSVLTEFAVNSHHHHLVNHQVRELALPKGTLLISIQKGKQMVIPNGLTRIQCGDHLLILTKQDSIEDLHHYLRS